MRVWNLSELEELTEIVVDELPNTKLVRPRSRCSLTVFSPLNVLSGIATIALIISFAGIHVTQGSTRLTNWSVAISKNSPEIRPPLHSMFQDRFSAEWTEGGEGLLLDKIVENRLTKNTEGMSEAVIEFAFANQQESLTHESPVLGLETVRRIMKQRKTS